MTRRIVRAARAPVIPESFSECLQNLGLKLAHRTIEPMEHEGTQQISIDTHDMEIVTADSAANRGC